MRGGAVASVNISGAPRVDQTDFVLCPKEVKRRGRTDRDSIIEWFFWEDVPAANGGDIVMCSWVGFGGATRLEWSNVLRGCGEWLGSPRQRGRGGE